IDVVTRGEMLEQGVAVRVIEVQGNRVVVRADAGAVGANHAPGGNAGGGGSWNRRRDREPKPRGTMLAAIADWGVGAWLLAGLLLLLVVLVLILFKFLNLWIQAVMTRTKVSLPQLVGMSLRKVNPTVIVRGMIMANQAGLPLETRQLEAHFLAG